MKAVDPPIVWTIGTSGTWIEKDLSSYVNTDTVAVYIIVEVGTISQDSSSVGTGHTDSSWETDYWDEKNIGFVDKNHSVGRFVWLDTSDKINLYLEVTSNITFKLVALFTANDLEEWDSFPTLTSYTVSRNACVSPDFTSEIPTAASVDAPIFSSLHREWTDWRPTKFDLTGAACSGLRYAKAKDVMALTTAMNASDQIRIQTWPGTPTENVVLHGFLQADTCELNTGTVTPTGTTGGAWNELEAISSTYASTLYWIEHSLTSTQTKSFVFGLRPKGSTSDIYKCDIKLVNLETTTRTIGIPLLGVAGTDSKIEYWRPSTNAPTIRRLAYIGSPQITEEGAFTQGIGNNFSSTVIGTLLGSFNQTLGASESQIAPFFGEALITLGNGQNITSTNIATLEPSYSQGLGNSIIQTGLVSTSGVFTQGLGISISEISDISHDGSFTTTVGLVIGLPIEEYDVNILETINFIDEYIAGLIHTLSLSDSFNIDDTSTPEAIARILEAIEVSTSISTNAILNKIIIELTTLSESFYNLFPYSITDSITVDDQITNILNYLELVLEVSNIDDIESSLLSGNNQVIEDLSVSDLATKFFLKLILEVVEATALHDPNVLFKMVSSEDITVSETSNNILTLSMIANEDIIIDESFIPNYIGNILVNDKAKFLIDLKIDDEIYSGWVINPENYAISNYDFSFNSSAPFDDKYLFTDSSGLYELGGILDETDYITSSITTAGLNFDSDSDKQVPQVLLGITGNKLILQVSVDDKHTVYYELNDTSDNLSTKQIKIGKGLIGKNWQFSLQTVDESDFALDSIEFYPVILKRKH